MPKESGFSGYVEILGAYISTNSQLNTDSDNRKTDSLDSAGERVGKFRALPIGLVRYTFAEYRTQLFLGVLPENIAQGQRTPEEVVQAWMNSAGHRANILNNGFTHIGVGYVESGNYWTQQFITK